MRIFLVIWWLNATAVPVQGPVLLIGPNNAANLKVCEQAMWYIRYNLKVPAAYLGFVPKCEVRT